MFRHSLCAISLAGLVLTGSALAAEPQGNGAPAAVTADPSSAQDLDKIECRTMAPVTGSRLGAKRQCRTVRDWNELRDRAQKALNDIQSQGLQKTVPGG